ncbi:PREDICTED: collagen alpha-1(II) chain-like [Capra hircus]|uniref:collagen alpha-1(II) chain-like n=1 Tax=Capra hircus TaxID=9925 RepID=UPI000847745B|nr:PREDICTED: collagen alpha-1(II) chain-like [Capra hircus]
MCAVCRCCGTLGPTTAAALCRGCAVPSGAACVPGNCVLVVYGCSLWPWFGAETVEAKARPVRQARQKDESPQCGVRPGACGPGGRRAGRLVDPAGPPPPRRPGGRGRAGRLVDPPRRGRRGERKGHADARVPSSLSPPAGTGQRDGTRARTRASAATGSRRRPPAPPRARTRGGEAEEGARHPEAGRRRQGRPPSSPPTSAPARSAEDGGPPPPTGARGPWPRTRRRPPAERRSPRGGKRARESERPRPGRSDKPLCRGLTFNRSQRGSCSATYETPTQKQVVYEWFSTRCPTNVRCVTGEGAAAFPAAPRVPGRRALRTGPRSRRAAGARRAAAPAGGNAGDGPPAGTAGDRLSEADRGSRGAAVYRPSQTPHLALSPERVAPGRRAAGRLAPEARAPRGSPPRLTGSKSAARRRPRRGAARNRGPGGAPGGGDRRARRRGPRGAAGGGGAGEGGTRRAPADGGAARAGGGPPAPARAAAADGRRTRPAPGPGPPPGPRARGRGARRRPPGSPGAAATPAAAGAIHGKGPARVQSRRRRRPPGCPGPRGVDRPRRRGPGGAPGPGAPAASRRAPPHHARPAPPAEEGRLFTLETCCGYGYGPARDLHPLPRIFKGRRELTGRRRNRDAFQGAGPSLGANPFQGALPFTKKRELSPGLPPASPGSVALPHWTPRGARLRHSGFGDLNPTPFRSAEGNGGHRPSLRNGARPSLRTD